MARAAASGLSAHVLWIVYLITLLISTPCAASELGDACSRTWDCWAGSMNLDCINGACGECDPAEYALGSDTKCDNILQEDTSVDTCTADSLCNYCNTDADCQWNQNTQNALDSFSANYSDYGNFVRKCETERVGSSVRKLCITTFAMDCKWKDSDEQKYYDRLLAGVIAGITLSILAVIIASLPVCCGVGVSKQLFGCGLVQILGGFALFLAILGMICPFFGVASATTSTVDEICGSVACVCSEETKTAIRSAISALGVIVVYLFAFGWVALLIGGIATCISCCAMCPCCGPAKTYKKSEDPQFVGGVIVGRPVELKSDPEPKPVQLEAQTTRPVDETE